VLDGVTDPSWLRQIKDLFQEALDAQPPQDSPMRARLLAQLAVNLGWTSTAESMALSDAALAMAERLDDRGSTIDHRCSSLPTDFPWRA